MTEIQHLQKILLLIIKDIDALCKRNNIDYYLLGGSCIGAIRHGGFIPWDDDLDIIMTRENYLKFIKICHEQLDDKYIFQEGIKDWPLNFSKIRLKGTYIHEPEDEYTSEDMHGIYVDVFYLENVPDNHLLAILQYLLAKYYLCYQLGCRGYKKSSYKKKLLMFLAFPMKLKFIRNVILGYINFFNERKTSRLGFYYSNSRFKNSITSRNIYGKPKYVKFEDTELPVPQYFHDYLTQMFGDYMTLPPLTERKGHHLISANFGEY